MKRKNCLENIDPELYALVMHKFMNRTYLAGEMYPELKKKKINNATSRFYHKIEGSRGFDEKELKQLRQLIKKYTDDNIVEALKFKKLIQTYEKVNHLY